MSFIGLGAEKQVGDYVLNELLIEGPIAQIYQGTHIPTGEKVAIKVFNKIKLHSVPNDLMKAEKEISILRKMFHKNIIKLYEIMETSQRIYLVMEYCEGGDLFNYILTKGHLTERQACKFFHEIIEALTYLHSQQIAHRDIKPENLLLNTTGKSISLKLIDFGVANNYDDKILHTSCGTCAFAAPEMFTGENYNALLCDIWSAGIVLYAMAFGYLPFGDENEQTNINNIINGNFEIPDEANDDLRDLLVNIIEINPNKRFNLEQIKAHKWYNIINNTSIPGIIITKHKIPIDDRIISVCQAYGFTQDNLIQSVTENVYDNNASIYYIILNKFIRERFDSVSDLFSQDYLDYINNPINLINYSKNNENEKNKNNETNMNNENNNNNINHNSFYSEKSDNNNENNENNQNNENNGGDQNNENNENNDNSNINDKNHNISFNSGNSDNDDKNENNDIINKNHKISFNSENSENTDNNDNKDNNDKNEKYENNLNNNEYNNNKSYNSSNNKNIIENIYSNDNTYNNEHNNTNEINNKDEKENSEKESNNNDCIKSNNNIEIKDANNDVDVDEKKNNEIEDEMVNDNDINNEETKNENKIVSSADNNEYSLECSINNHNNLRRSEDDDYFDIKIKIKKKEVRKDVPETKEKKNNNNDINESTEDFQINNIFSESEQNNNLRKSNYNENQKNEIFSSLSELSPKRNLDNNSDEGNNDLNIKNQNKNLIEKINDANEEEQNNKKESMKEGKPKPKVKMQITNMSIFIQSTYKKQNKNESTDNKDITNNKNKQNKKFVKNYNNILQNKNIRKKIYNNKVKEKEIKNIRNKKINNINKINNIYNKIFNKNNNQKIKVKDYTIITNRNSSAINRKLFHNNLSKDKKSNNKTNNSNSKNRKLKDISYRKLDNIKKNLNNNNLNKSNIKKRNNINIEQKYTDRNKISISKQFKSGMFPNKPEHSGSIRIYKNQLTKNNQFNNNPIDISSLMKDTKSQFLNYSSYIKNKDNHRQNNNYSSSKLSNNKSLNVKMHLIFKSALNKNNSCKDNSQISKKINFRKMILNSNQNKSFSNHRLRRSNRQKNHHNIINNRNYNTFFNDLYSFNEKSKSSNKKSQNKSFELNINREKKEKKENNLKNVKKELEKSLNNIKINNYNPKSYKGPIDLKNIITSYKIDDIFKEIISFLNKNEIHFNWEKNNKCRLLCIKNEEMFEIEIFSIYNKTIENKASNKLYYFLYISKAKHKLFLKSCLDVLNKLLLEKFGIKNFCSK